MENKEKNAPTIRDIEKNVQDINNIITHFQESYSNREASLVVTNLQQAVHWAQDQIKSLS